MPTRTTKRLDELGIGSRDEASELEQALGVSLQKLSRDERRVWLQQSRYLKKFSETRTVSTAARHAGVTVHTTRSWERDNVLGFMRRLEIAELEFCDALEELALERAREPKSTPTLITALLGAHLPSRYSSKAIANESVALEVLVELRKFARRDRAYRESLPDAEAPDRTALVDEAERILAGKGAGTGVESLHQAARN